MAIDRPDTATRRGIRIYRGWWIVGTGYFAQMAAAGSSGWVFGVLLSPMEEDLGWSRTELVGVLTISSIVAGLLSVWLGPKVDRHGARTLMTVSALLGGTALIFVSMVQELWQYYLCWALFGLATPGFGMLAPRTMWPRRYFCGCGIGRTSGPGSVRFGRGCIGLRPIWP